MNKKSEYIAIISIVTILIVSFVVSVIAAPRQDGKNWVGLKSEMTSTLGTNDSRYFTTDTLEIYIKSAGSWSLTSGGSGTGGGGIGDMLASVYDPNTVQQNVYDRQFHTGQQSVSTISDFSPGNYQLLSEKNSVDGYPGLNANTQIDDAQVHDLSYIRGSEIDRFCSGLVTGGSFSINADNQRLDVQGGAGYINDHSGTAGTYAKILFSSATVTTAGNGTNHIMVDSAGWIHTVLNKEAMSNHIYLGHAYVSGGYIAEIFPVPEWTGHYQGRMNEWVAHGVGTLVATGFYVTEPTDTLHLNVSSGEYYARLGEFISAGTITIFTKMYNTADNGWVQDSGSPNTVNVLQYNDPTQNQASALVTMSTSTKWKKDMVIITPTLHVYYIYGQTEFDSEVDALQGSLPAVPEAITQDAAALATIVLQKGDASIATRIHDIRPNLARVFGFGTSSSGGTIDHGTLSGLDHDDHVQYWNDARGFANVRTQGTNSNWQNRTQVITDLTNSISSHAGLTSGVHGLGTIASHAASEYQLVSGITQSIISQGTASAWVTAANVSSQISTSQGTWGYQTAANVASAISTSATNGNWQSAAQVSSAISTSQSTWGYRTTSDVAGQITTSLGAFTGSVNISTIGSSVTGTVSSAVDKYTNQTIAGVKTFNTTIIGNVTGTSSYSSTAGFAASAATTTSIGSTQIGKMCVGLSTGGTITCTTDAPTGGIAFNTLADEGAIVVSAGTYTVLNFVGGGIQCGLMNSMATCTVPTPSASAGGTDQQIQYNNATALDGMANVRYSQGTFAYLPMVSSPTPTTTGVLNYPKKIAGKSRLMSMDELGVEDWEALAFGARVRVMIRPAGSATGTTIPFYLGTVATVTSVVSNPALASTNYSTSLVRSTFTSGATNTLANGFYGPRLYWTRGWAAGIGGFDGRMIWFTSTNAGANATNGFYGLRNATTIVNTAEPSTWTETVYAGYNKGQATYQLCSNGPSGSSICTDCGQPYSTVSTTMVYQFVFSAPTNSGSVYADLRILNPDMIATAPCTTTFTNAAKLPLSTSFLNYYMMQMTRAASATAMDFVHMEIQ